MNRTYRIAMLVGSLRRESFNARLAQAVAKLAPQGFTFAPVHIDDLPLYNQDNDGNPPEAATRLKREIEAADGVLFVTPEYNRSVPGVLKNAIDTASRPYGKNSFAGKPAGIVGASVGSVGTAVAQLHLRSILGYLDMPTLGQPEVYLHFKEGMIAADGSIGSDDTRQFLQGFVDRYTAWVQRLATAR